MSVRCQGTYLKRGSRIDLDGVLIITTSKGGGNEDRRWPALKHRAIDPARERIASLCDECPLTVAPDDDCGHGAQHALFHEHIPYKGQPMMRLARMVTAMVQQIVSMILFTFRLRFSLGYALQHADEKFATSSARHVAQFTL